MSTCVAINNRLLAVCGQRRNIQTLLYPDAVVTLLHFLEVEKLLVALCTLLINFNFLLLYYNLYT